jgi:23S rRNA (guanosine2251-2'-O)-methyltransferase
MTNINRQLPKFTKEEIRVRQEAFNKEVTIHLVLDNIRSAFNVGSLFRTADAVGEVKLYLCGITSDIDNPKLYKTALGATKSVPSKHFPNPLDAITELKEQNISIYSLELTDRAEHFQKVNYPKQIAIILGHERLGVSQPFLDASEKDIYIPMNGMKKSLNVANAGAIAMYEAIRN